METDNWDVMRDNRALASACWPRSWELFHVAAHLTNRRVYKVWMRCASRGDGAGHEVEIVTHVGPLPVLGEMFRAPSLFSPG
eukprot:7264066-Karenia_brevis.AAC.1